VTLELRGAFEFGPITKAMTDGARAGLAVAAEHVLQVSNTKVPNEEGTLERSGKASVDDAGTTAAVSYDTPYAVRQHEELTYSHPGGRQAKYLELSLNSEAATCGALVAAAIRRMV
jgi:hypothetical protein